MIRRWIEEQGLALLARELASLPYMGAVVRTYSGGGSIATILGVLAMLTSDPKDDAIIGAASLYTQPLRDALPPRWRERADILARRMGA
jgi:hypothetical protein